MLNINNTFTCIPGWGFRSTIWPDLGMPMQLLELPSCQTTTLSEVAHALHKTIAPQSTLVGWSLGGLVALALAHQYPDLCRHLILVAATPCFIADDIWPGITPDVANGFQEQFNRSPTNALHDFMRLVLHPNTTKTCIAEHALTEHEDLHSYLNLLFTSDLRNEYAALTCPITVILGAHDALIPQTLGNALIQVNPRTSLHMISKAGHIPFLTHKTQFISLLQEACNDDS